MSITLVLFIYIFVVFEKFMNYKYVIHNKIRFFFIFFFIFLFFLFFLFFVFCSIFSLQVIVWINLLFFTPPLTLQLHFLVLWPYFLTLQLYFLAYISDLLCISFALTQTLQIHLNISLLLFFFVKLSRSSFQCLPMAYAVKALYLVSFLLMVSNLQSCVHGDPQVPCYFIFGDSLADGGNNNDLRTGAKVNYPPYGIDFPGGPTGRFTNGLTIVDIIGNT